MKRKKEPKIKKSFGALVREAAETGDFRKVGRMFKAVQRVIAKSGKIRSKKRRTMRPRVRNPRKAGG